MDADSALNQPFVSGVDRRPDGSYGIRYTVHPGGPYPSALPTGGTVAGDLVDAISVSAADWGAYSPADLKRAIATQWVSHVLPPPPPPDIWSDVETFDGSTILTSASANWTAAEWHPGSVIVAPDASNAIPSGVTIVAVLDGNHVQISAPATADASGVTVRFTHA